MISSQIFLYFAIHFYPEGITDEGGEDIHLSVAVKKFNLRIDVTSW